MMPGATPTGSNTDPEHSIRASRLTAPSNPFGTAVRGGRYSSAPLTVDADQMHRVPRSRAPLKKYGDRVAGRGEICRPKGPVRNRPGHESAVCAETSNQATPPGEGTSNRNSGSDILRCPSRGVA